MEFSEYIDHFKITPRRNILNLISLEISKTKINDIISVPNLIKKLSWVSNGIWPKDKEIQLNKNHNHILITGNKPQVQKYCLISAQGSYTDFHIDFGGSSVWYHVFSV